MEAGAIDRDAQFVRWICITGMHRTGTSVVAGLLQRHGLWLGDAADMMSADPFNPEGYFENNRLVEVNDAILALFGGSWNMPPEFPAAWTDDPRLAYISDVARAMGERLDGRRPWGFKDPRTALTLPFWRSVWGEVAVIVTVRNPLETARSLKRRDDMPLQAGMGLWSTYYRSILQQTSPESRMVVEYEGLCTDPVGSAAALLSGLPGLTGLDEDVARESVRLPLRHYHATAADLQAHGATSDLLELYTQLRGEAINRTETEHVAETLRPIMAALSGLDLAIRDVHVDLQRLAAVVTRIDGEIEKMRSGQQPDPLTAERVPAFGAAADAASNGRRG
jgi:hypothetical protein